jgi:ribosome-binding factor A
MSNRTLRVNELIQRELSAILRQDYQSESVSLTITEVRVAPDLRDARVFVSVVGDETEQTAKLRWLRAQSRPIRQELGRRIVLKYLPRFEYVLDHSVERGTHLLKLLDEVAPPPAAET